MIQEGDILEYDLSADQQGRVMARNARVIDQPTTACAPIRYGDIGVDEAA